ncbi:DUF4387 domain-containing protein [Gordoniibacillus kamchatkensis]|nr:DUF4387 domain-containing protein [Paenibacillus sp. VKM B-2647]
MKLKDIAQVIRSKNSGPFELTFDIIFKDRDMFEMICSKKIINRELISKLYNIPHEKVFSIIEFKPANAIKATIVRPVPSGNPGDTDVYGAQQHVPLLGIELEL